MNEALESRKRPMESRQAVLTERMATVAVWGCAIVLTSALGWILADVIHQGASKIEPSLLWADVQDSGRSGGIGPIIVSTIAILTIMLAVVVPLSLSTAVVLSASLNRRSRVSSFVSVSLDVLAAVPSIVFGLFGNAFFCIALGWGYSLLSGGMTLACMVLPITTRLAQQAIVAVPYDHQLSAASLGISRTSTLLKIVLPSAMPAMTAGLVIGIGRASAETAALLFTSGYVSRMPSSPMDSGRTISVHIYDLAMNVPAGNDSAYASAMILVVLLAVINLAATLLCGFAGQAFSGVSDGNSA